MSNNAETKTPTGPAVPRQDISRERERATQGSIQAAPEGQRVQLMGIDLELAQDIRDCLRQLPHKEVDQVLRRLNASRILDVTVTNAPPRG